MHLPLIEFAYNNSYHESIEMAPYKALYGRKCRPPLYWEVSGRQLTSPELVQVTLEKIPIIQQRLRITCSGQKSYVDSKRKDESFFVGDMIFFKVSPIKGVMRFGKKGS